MITDWRVIIIKGTRKDGKIIMNGNGECEPGTGGWVEQKQEQGNVN
jgi:hypothetical protein